MKKLLSRVIASAVAVTLSLSAMAVNPTAKAIRTLEGKSVEVSGSHAALKKLPTVHMIQRTAKPANLFSVGRPCVKRNTTVAAAPMLKVGATELYGCLLYSEDLELEEGYYTIPTTAPVSLTPVEEAKGLSVWGATEYDGVLYAVQVIQSWFGTYVYNYQIDVDTWEVLAEGMPDDFSTVSPSYAADPETGDIYGVFYNPEADGLHFGVLDVEELTSSEICEMDEMMYLAFDEEGTLYAINYDGDLYEMDTETGELLLLAETGIVNQYITGMAIDGKTIYYTVCTDVESALYAIDLDTYEGVKVYDFETYDEVAGLFVPAPAAAEGAPAIPTDVEVEIADDLTGTVTFTAPATTYGGEALSGTIKYNIYDGDSNIATGTCEAGTVVEAAVKLDKPGSYAIRVSCQNEVGEGPKTKAIKGFAGSLIPPYVNNFSNESDLQGFTFIDANGDGVAWFLYQGALAISYNSEEAMDDYAVTPPFYFESGKAYNLTASVFGMSESYEEKVEFLLVKGTTEADMADGEVLIAETAITWTEEDAQTVEGVIGVPESGKYYIAIHGISEADQYYLFVDDLAISAPFDGNTPRMVEDVVFNPAYNGEPSTMIAFKAPALDLNGDALEGTITVKGTLNGEEFWSQEVVPGSDISINCVAEEMGTYTIALTAYNENGAGRTYAHTLWLGINLAAAPENVAISEWQNAPGKVTVSWTGVAKDCLGHDIDASYITYMVLDVNQDIVAEDIPCTEECEIDIDAVPEGEQTFVLYYVVPVTAKGPNVQNGFYGITDLIPVGTPYEMPMIEDFDGEPKYAWLTRTDAGYTFNWGLASSVGNINPVDGDGGMLYWWPLSGCTSSVISAKVAVAEAETVAFSFFYCATTDGDYDVMPIVRVKGYEYEMLDEPINTVATQNEWKQVIVPLVDYCGADVQVGIKVTCNDDTGYMLLDQICAMEMLQYDLAAASITAPKAVEVGKKATITAEIANQGMDVAEDFSVQFYCNGEKYGEAIAVAEALNAGGVTTVSTEVEYDIFADPEYTFYFDVVWDKDENLNNNISENAIIIVSQPLVPAVEDLEATVDNGNVVLTWTAPDVSAVEVVITDDVESYESFAINQAGDWTFVDVDQSNNYGFSGIEFPGTGDPAAFIVFDAPSLGDDVAQALDGISYSGDKVFACFAAVNAPNDDWMISPNLPGMAQTISFMARAWMEDYGLEQFEVYYSMDGPAITNMVMVSDGEIEVGAEWTKFSFELPEGATNFAIRCVSNDRFIFLVDDITFTAGTEALTINGYNVYCGTEHVTSTTEPTATVELPGDGEYVYFVTVVYEGKGESALSNPAVVNATGIADAAKAVRVSVEGRQIVVENAESVMISAADGKVVASAKGEAKVNATVAPGVYVVKTNARTTKVIVK